MKLATAMIALGITLWVVVVALANLAIYYSSFPHNSEMGWAICCGVNAVWVFLVGGFFILASDSPTVRYRQLDKDREREAVAA